LADSENTDKAKLNRDETKWSESPYLIIKGFLMGSADIVPGVSGGTMALITGIYDRLIYAIKSVDKDTFLNVIKFRFSSVFETFHWKFLTLLFTGIILAIAFFTKIVPLQVYMFTHPEIVYGLFFGLIVGSIVLLIAEISPEKRGWKNLFPLVAGALFGFWIVTLVPTDTPEAAWFVLLSGSIAICAMILPGISGSYLLLIMRKYDYILSQVGSIGTVDTASAIMNLLPFFAGAALGLILFSRLLSWLLNNFHATTLLVLIGFLIGSLYVIWPYQDREFQDAVRSTQIMEYTDPVVQEMLEREEPPKLPEYKRIKEVINPGASFDALKKVEVETVSRKLLKSQPIIPDADSSEVNLWGGIYGMAGGLFMILFISYLRRV
jgi:putative membrane protein